MQLFEITTLILEDQELVAENLRRTLINLGVKKVRVATSAELAERIFNEDTIDLILVDINLGENKKSGTDLMLELTQTTPIPHIYITANADEKNIKAASETSPEGFLEKPFTKEGVNACISIAVHKMRKQKTTITLHGKKALIDFSEILYVESQNNHIKIILENGKKAVERIALKDFIERLSPHFLQIHKSYVINMQKVEKYTATEVIIHRHHLPIGRSYKHKFKDQMKSYLPD